MRKKIVKEELSGFWGFIPQLFCCSPLHVLKIATSYLLLTFKVTLFLLQGFKLINNNLLTNGQILFIIYQIRGWFQHFLYFFATPYTRAHLQDFIQCKKKLNLTFR